MHGNVRTLGYAAACDQPGVGGPDPVSSVGILTTRFARRRQPDGGTEKGSGWIRLFGLAELGGLRKQETASAFSCGANITALWGILCAFPLPKEVALTRQVNRHRPTYAPPFTREQAAMVAAAQAS
jgi:hypothetical protein